MAFIQGEKPEGCFFCAKGRDSNDRANHVLRRGTYCFALLNAYPYAAGHVLIAPYDHLARLEDLAPDAATEMIVLAQKTIVALRQAEKAANFNLGMNLGPAAGAGVADHIHLHVVPRYAGDNNFIPVIGDSRLIPETLDTSYEKLAPLLAETNR